MASPLHKKLSTTDPSLKLVELAAGLRADAIKIGLTHGALAIEAKHQPNDFPIALNAATRAGLDYLAVGHWHNWLPDTDGGRIVMPGIPEPDRFIKDVSGNVALVEITAHDAPLRVQPLPVATLNWRTLTFDFLAAESSCASLASALSELSSSAARTVLRVTLTGTASPDALTEIRAWLEPQLNPFLIGQLCDQTRIALTLAELADWQVRHPILARGWSARIAHDLIEHRKQAATKAVLTPLENRLTAAFAELTGDTAREVFLDEHLQIAGIGRTRDTAHAFEQLSQGAKEQLLLCLRLVVAQELATEEPQVLILDDDPGSNWPCAESLRVFRLIKESGAGLEQEALLQHRGSAGD